MNDELAETKTTEKKDVTSEHVKTSGVDTTNTENVKDSVDTSISKPICKVCDGISDFPIKISKSLTVHMCEDCYNSIGEDYADKNELMTVEDAQEVDPPEPSCDYNDLD